MHQEQSKDPAGRGTLQCPRAASQLRYGKTKAVHRTSGQPEQPKALSLRVPHCTQHPMKLPGLCSAKRSADMKERMSGLRG